MIPRRKKGPGYVYVLAHSLTPSDDPHIKIGYSATRPDHSDSRLEAPNFWMRAFGLGEVELRWISLYHPQAHQIEQRAMKPWKNTDLHRRDCGSATEIFRVQPSEAIDRIYAAFEELGY